jgi:hypothetical protein
MESLESWRQTVALSKKKAREKLRLHLELNKVKFLVLPKDYPRESKEVLPPNAQLPPPSRNRRKSGSVVCVREIFRNFTQNHNL